MKTRLQTGLGWVLLLWLAVMPGCDAAWAQVAQTGTGTVSAGYSKGNAKQPSEDHVLDAEKDYVEGARALSDGKAELAEKHFARAAALDPTKSEYTVAVSVAREHRVTELVQAAAQARRKGKKADADAMLAEAAKLDPDNDIVKQHMMPGAKPMKVTAANVIEAANRDAAARLLVRYTAGPGQDNPDKPVELQMNGQRHSFHMRASGRQLIQTVMQNYGVKATLDDSVSARQVRLDVDDVTLAQLIPVVDELTHTFVAPVDAHSVMVGADTTEVHDRLDRQIYETVYLPGFSEDEMKSALSVAREIFGIKQSAMQAGGQTLTVRGPEETLRALNATLGELMDNDSEVMLDISLYEMDTTNSRQTGVTPPQQITAFNFDSEIQQVVTANQSTINQAISSGLVTQGNYLEYAELLLAAGLLQNTVFGQSFALFGNGLTRTGTSGVGSTLTMALNTSDSRMLDETNILSDNKQEGTFKAGERYPIITSTYSNLAAAGTSAASLSGLSASQLALLGLSGTAGLATGTTATIPQIQYEDLGLTLKTTPTIFRDGSMTLHFDLKLESLSGSSANGIPILNNRAFSGDVKVQEGQNAVIVSNLTKEESGAISGTPGLSELPGFDDITSKTTNGSGQQLVMVIRPHLVRRVQYVHAGPMVMLAMHPSTFREAPVPVERPSPAGPPPAPGVVPVQTSGPNSNDSTPTMVNPGGRPVFGANGTPTNTTTGNGANQ